MSQAGRELRLAAEALHHAGIGGECWMQDLDGYVALEREIAGSIDAPKASRANLFQQLIVVAQRAPQAALEARLRHGRCGGEHLEGPGITHEVLEHLRRRVVSILGNARQRTD